MSGLFKHRWILNNCFYIQSCDTSFWLKHMRKIQPYTGMWLKKEDILIASPDYCLFVFKISLFLKAWWLYGTWNYISELLILCYIKGHWSIWHCESTFYPCLIYSMRWSFRKYLLTDVVVNYITTTQVYIDLLSVWHISLQNIIYFKNLYYIKVS